MSDAVKEQLSAYLDGELPEAELDLLARRLGSDAALRDVLGRYALCSEALKSGKLAAAPQALTGAFAANVMAALEREDLPGQPQALRRRSVVSAAVARRLRPVAGFAVAASVAALAVISVQRAGMTPATVADDGGAGSAESAVVQTLAVADPEPSYTVPSTTSNRAFIPATRLTNYVVAHAEYSSPLGRRSMLSGVLAEGDSYVPEDPADAESSDAGDTNGADKQVTQP